MSACLERRVKLWSPDGKCLGWRRRTSRGRGHYSGCFSSSLHKHRAMAIMEQTLTTVKPPPLGCGPGRQTGCPSREPKSTTQRGLCTLGRRGGHLLLKGRLTPVEFGAVRHRPVAVEAITLFYTYFSLRDVSSSSRWVENTFPD